MQLNLKQIPWYYRVALFALVAVAALGAYYYYYESGVRADLATKQQQLDGLRAEIARGRAIAQKLQEFQAEVGELEARLDNLKAVLPEQKDVGDLLRRIQTLATQSNLEILAFKPLAVVTKQMHAEWPISLELEGSYHDLGLFFDKVSKVPRIINISGIAVKGQEAAKQSRRDTSRLVSITAQCLATTFVLLETPAPAPADAKAKAAGAKRPGGKPAPAAQKK